MPGNRSQTRSASCSQPKTASPNNALTSSRYAELKRAVQKLSARAERLTDQAKIDLHGRYVTHLCYSQAEVTIDQCFTEGLYLNAELVDAGHAELMG